MRLTLRTMLAYLEGVLDATDSEQLAHKIEESEFAASLMHRVRDVTRRLKLGAPKLDGRGLASDPNTVSEYLDNTLPADRVPEFEKICLESDVHLAEVASVHQILALVLGEQAEFDPNIRQRMYKLVEEADAIDAEMVAAGLVSAGAPALAGAPVSAGTAGAPREPAKPRRRPEIPDYLREVKERPNYVPYVLAAAVLVCLGAGSLLFVDFNGNGSLVANLNPGQPANPQPADDSPEAKTLHPTFPGGQAPDEPGAPGEVSPSKPGEDATPPGSFDGAGPVDAANPTEGGADRAAPIDDGKVATDVDAAMPDETAEPAGAKPAGAGGAPAKDDQFRSLVDGVDPAFQTELPPVKSEEGFMPDPAPAVIGDPDVQPGPPAPDTEGPDADGPTVRKGPPLPRPSVLDDDTLATAAANPVQPAAGAPIVGRLTNDSEVLLRPGGPENAWIRLSTRDALSGGNELIALPSYRPSINFNTNGGATAQLLGGTVARLLPPNASGVPGLQIIDGQVVLLTAGKPGTQLQLQVGDKVFLATFVDPDSTLAIDVRRILPEGGDPIRDSSRTTAELYVSSGVVDIGPLAGGKHEALTVPDRKTLMGVPATDGAVNTGNATLPAWIVGTTPNQTDKRATLETERLLTAGDTVRTALEELSHERRVEFRNLAVQSLITMGDFEALLPALNDPMQKANWNAQIEAARRAMARNHQTAKALKATLEAQREPKKADDLYKLLCGISRQELLAGADRWLVNELDNDDMDYRVLAFWNLRQVSVGTLDYHPEHNTSKKRAVGVRAWKLRSDARQIVPKS